MDAPQELPYYVGHLLPKSHGVITYEELDGALDSKYDMIAGYITNAAFKSRIEKTIINAREAGKDITSVKYLEESEVNLHPGDHISQVVAYTAPWNELDSTDPLVAGVAKQVLKHEMAYAAFCGINNVVIAGPRSIGNIAQYAQSISTVLATSMYMQVHIHLPLVEVEPGANAGGISDPYSAWDMWNTIRSICRYNLRLSIALRLPSKLPKIEVQDRWLCEPVRLLTLSSSIFLLNNKGYPVLSKHHQQLIGKYTRLRPVPYIMLSDIDHQKAATTSMTASQTSSKSQRAVDPNSYLAYIRHLQKNQLPLTVLERAGAGYQDYLQSPLQPLADNLESSTYEVFEKDPVKYDQYEKAIQLALEERDPKTTINVAVVGAGRGPLVSRALRAAQSAGRDIILTAVEKNPNAYVTLLRHNRETWGGRVTVIKSDMRSWHPEFKVDILISELLGSFGDNELSPECLDGVQRVLSRDGISIPTSYSAHFTPVMAPKLHADITNRFTAEPTASETPYVVYLHAVELLAQDKYIHNAWEFTHPMPSDEFKEINLMHQRGITEGANEHNTRFSKHTFKIPTRGVIHGLGGYFESVLYKDVELSIRPDTIDAKSKDMTSWFPMFFPIKTPLQVPDFSEVDISIWRLTDDKKVWYDWIVETYTVLDDTKRSRLGVSDLHSSKKVACLM